MAILRQLKGTRLLWKIKFKPYFCNSQSHKINGFYNINIFVSLPNPKEDTKYTKEMMAIKENHSIISKTHLLIFKEDLLVLVE